MKVLQVALALLVLPSSTEAHRRGGPRTKATEEQHRVKKLVPEAAKKKQAERAAVSDHQTKVKSDSELGKDNTCVDDATWYDSDGEEYGCKWYKTYAQFRCVKFGRCFENDGKTANQACCDTW